MMKVADNLYCFTDTCNVYALCSGDEAVLIDFGNGSALSRLAALGITCVTDVLMTHHHRDQGQGLPYAVAAGARIWVPHVEQDLFRDVDIHWQARTVLNDYNMRQDRFSLLEPVPVAGTLRDYGVYRFGGYTITVIPTPGHTVGSLSLLVDWPDGRRLIFTGDLIAAPGKVWSLAATQWTYNGAEGVAATILSLFDLKKRQPDLLLPSHGAPIAEPASAMDLLVERLRRLIEQRKQNPYLFTLSERPYGAITPHLLRNLTSTANVYVLLSDSGKALFIDFGYDFMSGFAAGSDRASRRPWLYTLDMLKQQYGVQKIEVAIPTHYHDDHVAGLNLLRDVEGTEVWAAETFADILEHPTDYDLPCLWYDPIPVDRVLPLERPFQWQEYELTLYDLPGHTRYAVAIGFTVDGKRVLATGDQYQGNTGLEWNYVYRNHFQIGDYVASAALYRRLAPDVVLTGHWGPLWVTPVYLEALEARGTALEQLHRELLPLEMVDFGAEGFGANIRPYQAHICSGETAVFTVEVRNPFARAAEAVVRPVAPSGWQVEETAVHVSLPATAVRTVQFRVTPPVGLKARRVRIAADLTIDNQPFGQQAEALVTVK